ncbi:hypothetical protein DSL72_006176 [Monilinia vaccinii-corymbosi]|uniref:Uncharacterized protein n=1 Tax=Monilinia vaccinii-corymbosi TaxID=61207 RepID=A0A8A3PH00_9HELO|nr:hypothetical protein DSL72_006176 [Monilinia vaccinii-corymbosi]
MMATEATSENFAAPSKTPDHELNTTEPKSQDVPSEQTFTTNATNVTVGKDGAKQNSDFLEPINNSAEVSVSGGSDTEATKAETSKIGDEKSGHARSTSTVKKPVPSFKAVSVNKTFLASKASTAVTPSKVGDKGPAASTTAPTTLTASTSSTPKPRLVAKTGSSLRDSTPRASTAANGGKAGGAPDASAVWNKNRPAPPPEPKRFTDEELKQRYGIHLATRLQSDDPGKQANWADIDDDDDDWAPESIEWTDGTKITLPHADDAPPPPPEPVPEVAPVVKEIKKTEPAPKPYISPTPQAIAPPAPRLGSGKAGLILKGAPEKPTLVAKPPGPPTPVKSPWAQLPPVEKVAPVAIEISQNTQYQSQQNRFNQRDPHGFSGMPPPPAKEIAADDFSRTWRDGSAHASRELYNSQSGRYEPVNEARRGVSRSDGQFRGPAVLQRPSHHDGPAEPSAAFQTHHTSGQQGSYGRRRTSSNVSGGSGNFARRMSRGHEMPPPHDMLSARRGSLAAVSDAPSSPRNFSPSGQNAPPQQRGYQNQNQSWQSRASPVVSHQSPHSAYGQPAPVSGDMHMHSQGPPQGPPMGFAPKEDVLEEQKNIMRRTRELAIKRRQEAEAKEEAERKERIRIKLEAMGPPPEKKKVKGDVAKEETVPTSIQTREVNPTPPTKMTETSSDAQAPKLDVANENLNARHMEGNATDSDLRPNGAFQQNASASAQQAISVNRNPQSWQRNSASNYPPTDRFTSWSAAPPPPQNSSRIWGPPTNEKTIGNGTFNPELNRIPDVSRQSLSDMSHSSTHPGPIGPPGANRGNGPYQANRGRDQYNSRPPPIGPPSVNREPQPPRSYEEEQRRAMARSVWGGVSDRISQEDAILHHQQQEEIERKRGLEAAGMVEGHSQPLYEDTWKQVALNEDGTRGNTKNVSTSFIDGGSSGSPALAESMSRGNARPELSRPQYNSNAWPSGPETNAANASRESKFFPNNHRDNRFEEMNGHCVERSSSPSPPPPTMVGHPAYDSDFARPHVALPPPLPVVRLPPPTVVTPIAPPRPQSFAAAAAAPAVPAISQIPGLAARHGLTRPGSTSYDIRKGPTPSTQTGEWKEKIDQLFGKKSPPRTHALAVDSASRRAFDHSSGPQDSATVSLPGSISENSIDGEETLNTKPAAEECFEEQEMGSLPVIKIPHIAPQNAFQPFPAPRNIPRRFLVSDATSVDPIQFPAETSNNASLLFIMLPGQENPRSVHLPTSLSRNNPRRGRGGSRQTSSTHPRGGRGTRDANNGPAPTPRDTQSPNPSNTSSRGRGRGFGNNSNWNRHVATPIHT